MKHLNSWRLPPPSYPGTMIAMLLMLVACAHNPFKVAENPTEQVWVVVKEYRHILETQVLPAMRDENIPESIRRALGDGNRVGTPAVVALVKAASEFTQVKGEVLAGITTQDKLLIAAENLDSHLKGLQHIVADFKLGLKEAKS